MLLFFECLLQEARTTSEESARLLSGSVSVVFALAGESSALQPTCTRKICSLNTIYEDVEQHVISDNSQALNGETLIGDMAVDTMGGDGAIADHDNISVIIGDPQMVGGGKRAPIC